ncbi:putative RNA polymerase sigma factor 2 [Bacillus phage BSP36]|nr:putative RNA polymerase sigma factor 2 [Bacillus phage BSP36]
MRKTIPRVLSEEEVQELLSQIRKGSEEAKEILVNHSMGLVKKVVNKRFRYTEHPVEDLVSVGAEGLMRAINNYDVSQGVKFSTYATSLIIGKIWTYTYDNGFMKVPRKTRALAYKIKSNCLEESPVENIVQELSITEDDKVRVLPALDFLRNGNKPLSLDATLQGEEDSNGAADDRSLTDTSEYRNNDLNGEYWFDMVAIRQETTKLPELQQRILDLSFNKEMSHPEIGKLLNMPPHRVGTQKKAAINALRLVFLGEEGAAELKLKEKRKPFKRITPEQREQIIKLLKETTLTYDEIGSIVGVTHSPISKLAKEHRSPEVIQANRKRVHRNLAQYQKDKKKKGQKQNA